MRYYMVIPAIAEGGPEVREASAIKGQASTEGGFDRFWPMSGQRSPALRL